MLRKVDFDHCSLFCLILNLWTYWSCIRSGRYYDKLSDYIGWNLFYIQQKWPRYYLPFEIVYEKTKKQDVLFRPGNLSPANEQRYGHFFGSLHY